MQLTNEKPVRHKQLTNEKPRLLVDAEEVVSEQDGMFLLVSLQHLQELLQVHRRQTDTVGHHSDTAWWLVNDRKTSARMQQKRNQPLLHVGVFVQGSESSTVELNQRLLGGTAAYL